MTQVLLMNNRQVDSSFENYRRDRTRRRLQASGPARDMGQNEQVLKQLEEVERVEIQDHRLTREVHDFFADATRQAASIVNKISDSQEEEVHSRLRQEIGEFLNDVIRRAETFMSIVQFTRGNTAEQVMEPDVHNIVGRSLDEFRNEGTAQTLDKHIGEDPFMTSADSVKEEMDKFRAPEAAEPNLEVQDPLRPVYSHEGHDEVMLDDDDLPEMATDEDLAREEAERYQPEPEPEPEPEPKTVAKHVAKPAAVATRAAPAAATPPRRSKAELDRVKKALKVMISSGLMTVEQAQAEYQRLLRR